MKTFLEWVNKINELTQDTDLLQHVSNILANCRNDPYPWLGELSAVYGEAKKRGDREVERVMYELTQLATSFLNNIRQYLDPYSSKPKPLRGSQEYQQAYEIFMQQAHQLLDRIRK